MALRVQTEREETRQPFTSAFQDMTLHYDRVASTFSSWKNGEVECKPSPRQT
ncbi:hypothetical protein L484_015793 [Morus notabilis]|uniref:Uncharacterized protein n=1 Tax=Morus notabilis TaxID=981085 RepID=W9QD40_9ROSA|nr:hypothetical protein L484_015793 [Morus notabilis]